MTLQDRLTARGLSLPRPTATAFSYVPLSVHDGVAYMAGQIPKTGRDTIRAAGRVGAEVAPEDAREDAALCVLHALAWLAERPAGLDAVARPLRLTVYVAAAPGFDGISAVADGASELLVDLFGPEAGPHPRSVVAVSALPRNAPVMVEPVFALHA
jgi:enamine deaminase RidA (YjgF/YER057c/UK114 family)